MSQPEVKASGCNSVIETLRSMVHPEDFARFVDKLPPRSKALVEHPPIAMAWVPLEDMAVIFRLAHLHLFAGIDSRMEDLGRRQIRADLTGIYRLLMRIPSPAYIISQTAKLYATYARSCGEMRIVRNEPNWVEAEIIGRPHTSTAFWRYFGGNIFGIIDLAQVRSPTVALVAGGGDENWARFAIRWH